MFFNCFVLVGSVLLGLGNAHAEDLTTRTELQRGDLNTEPAMETILSKLRIMPGGRIPLHSHDGDELVYVLTGGDMETPEGKIVNFPDGMSLRFPRGQVHGGVTSRADGEVVLLTTHIVDKGKPLFTYVD